MKNNHTPVPPVSLPVGPATAAVDCAHLAERAFHRNVATHSLAHYTGIVSLHGLARLALSVADPAERERLLALVREHLRPFLDNGLDGHPNWAGSCNFPNYRIGGNGAAYLLSQGHLPAADRALFVAAADQIMTKAPRDRNGILSHPADIPAEKIWIDVAFAVTPFLLYTGLALNRDDLIQEAWNQIRDHLKLLRDPATGLINQARNFRGPGHRSQDHWSRGNGWGILALTELVNHLPDTHPARPEAEAAFTDLTTACIRSQDTAGLWHQELTRHDSFVETSGTGLILYAIGAGLERGLLGPDARAAFEKGLRALLPYVAVDGSVHNTCVGCLCPGQGTIEDYMNHPHRLNDPHAFGPVTLAYTQALRLGIESIAI
ncbi:glucuronyl hydrolase [Opitutaceae bacterium TAV5]|nr:glucuronyl hydrolase [Opitutaceae bacterium TAV5]